VYVEHPGVYQTPDMYQHGDGYHNPEIYNTGSPEIYHHSGTPSVIPDHIYNPHHSFQPFSKTSNAPIPPEKRRVQGLSPAKFWITLCAVCFLVVAAAVGGSVGGTYAVKKHFNVLDTKPTRDCASMGNGSIYDSLFRLGTSGPVTPEQGLKFQRLCSTDSRPGVPNVPNIAQGFYYTFDDCMELCASINFWSNSQTCIGVAYKGDAAPRPGNCWAHNTTGGVQQSSDSGIDSAMLAT
jgi:hypothetical protein